MDKITYDFMKNDTKKQGTETKKNILKTAANAVLNVVAPVGKTLELVKKGADQTVNTGLAIGRKAVNATTGISLADHLRKKLNVVLDATGAEYVHEVKITGIAVDEKLYNLGDKFTLNDTLGAAKELAALIKKGVGSDFKDTATTDAVKKDSKEDKKKDSIKDTKEDSKNNVVKSGPDNVLEDFLKKTLPVFEELQQKSQPVLNS